MKTYSYDLRERVVRACDEGRGTREAIAAWFGVSTAWVRRLLQRRRETGSFAAKPHAGGSPRQVDDGRLTAVVAELPDGTLADFRDCLGLTVHPCTVGRALARLDLTIKKKSCTRPSRNGRTCSGSGTTGAAGPPGSTRPGSSFWTRPARTRP